ncbi:MAG TPA: hypothetical protein VKY65_16145 [Alphaproteobacteria bacterium]|nr:hypothetical protein [Alphaproteobacteria bacterium]
MRRALTATAALLLLLGTAACSNLDETTKDMLAGGAVGVGTGAVVTAATGGCIWCGAAIGGAVGTAAGYLYDQVHKGNL